MPSSLITTALLLLLVLWTTVNGQCVDNEDRFEFRNKQGNLKSRKCVWAQQKKTSRRCTKIEEVALNCPNTCDTDCLRSPLSATGCRDSLYEFQRIAGMRPHKLCTWASARNTALRCSKFPTKLYCPLTCDSCDSEPSVSPTLSPQPSKSPTELPSSKPSLSIVPTKAVSSVPSSSPTFICNDATDKFFVHAPVGANKPCDPWVKRNPEHRCGMTAGLSTSVGVVSDFCPVTCGLCPDAPSAKPSLSPPPSLKPSVEPSSGPTFSSGEPSATKSQSPSDEPSLVPSDTPSEKPSDEPSISPSAMPSACNSSPWTVDVALSGGGTTTYNCDNIGSFCTEEGVGTQVDNDKTASQACCVCGGSLEHTVVPSMSPSNEPSQSPSGCVNYPKADSSSWTTTDDGTVYVCNDFAPDSNCAIIETPGTDGKTATEACCNCGGGDHVAT